jgi:GT2 family glycosyltransferase
VVIATRDRRDRLLATLARLDALPERPRVVVVDNGSRDGTGDAVRRCFPEVTVVESREPLGSAARNLGAEMAATPLVAFTDDDSWWAPGSLARAGELFAAYPRLGLIAARIVVEPDGRIDPTCAAMRESPLGADGALPGPPVLGFVACGAIARREAVLACGGFHPRYGFGGEEELVAIALTAAGWDLAYADDVVAHHEPERGPRRRRDMREARNALWSAWLRRPWPRALRLTARAAIRRGGLRALAAAARGAPWVLRERRVVPADVERSLRQLDGAR